jgi:peptide/nickel transport system ATP-binding protein
VALAAALARDPAVLIADEPTTALDVTTQKQILRLLQGLRSSRGMSLVLITHDLRVAFAVCDRVYVMYAGSLVETGPAVAVESNPLHPYTAALLRAEPRLDARQARLAALEGDSVSAYEVPTVCCFSSRCTYVQEGCLSGRPPLREVEPGRSSACVRVEELRSELASAATSRDPAVTGTASEAAQPILTVDGLTKVFPARGRRRAGSSDVTAVNDVSLEVGAGECVAIIGESGSGKSTIGRCLLGLETPTSGSMRVAGLDASDYARLRREERNKLRRTIQMVFQDPYSSLNPALKVGSMLREAVRFRGDGDLDLDGEAARLLTAVGLPLGYAALKPRSLSGGERQRVALARALAVEPRVLVCDECVSALDVAVQGQVLELLRALQAQLGMTYLFITHDLAVARQIADRLYVLERGVVVEEGIVDEVLDRPRHPYTQQLIASVPRSSPTWLSAPQTHSVERSLDPAC